MKRLILSVVLIGLLAFSPKIFTATTTTKATTPPAQSSAQIAADKAKAEAAVKAKAEAAAKAKAEADAKAKAEAAAKTKAEAEKKAKAEAAAKAKAEAEAKAKAEAAAKAKAEAEAKAKAKAEAEAKAKAEAAAKAKAEAEAKAKAEAAAKAKAEAAAKAKAEAEAKAKAEAAAKAKAEAEAKAKAEAAAAPAAKIVRPSTPPSDSARASSERSTQDKKDLASSNAYWRLANLVKGDGNYTVTSEFTSTSDKGVVTVGINATDPAGNNYSVTGGSNEIFPPGNGMFDLSSSDSTGGPPTLSAPTTGIPLAPGETFTAVNGGEYLCQIVNLGGCQVVTNIEGQVISVINLTQSGEIDLTHTWLQNGQVYTMANGTQYLCQNVNGCTVMEYPSSYPSSSCTYCVLLSSSEESSSEESSEDSSEDGDINLGGEFRMPVHHRVGTTWFAGYSMGMPITCVQRVLTINCGINYDMMDADGNGWASHEEIALARCINTAVMPNGSANYVMQCRCKQQYGDGCVQGDLGYVGPASGPVSGDNSGSGAGSSSGGASTGGGGGSFSDPKPPCTPMRTEDCDSGSQEEESRSPGETSPQTEGPTVDHLD